MKSPKENDPYRQDRIALLKYYNSQCMTHGGYVISIFVGLLVLISRFDVFIDRGILLVFGLIISGLSLLLIYTGYGILYWGYLASWVTYLPVTELSEEKKRLSEEKEREPTLMFVLNKASYNRVQYYHPYVVKVKNIPGCLVAFLSNERVCRYCGIKNKRDNIFCFECGKQISEDR